MNKKDRRIRRSRKTRAKIRELLVPRLTVHKTAKHIYAQVIDAENSRVIASASTVQKDVATDIYGGNITAAEIVGKTIAQRATDAGVSKVAFDRSGFKYHGRIHALAQGARDGGLKF